MYNFKPFGKEEKCILIYIYIMNKIRYNILGAIH